MEKLLDANEFRRWHRLFKRDGEVFEIRLLLENGNSLSGYFTDVETAIASITPYDRQQIYQIYFIVNEIHPACSSRSQYNKFLSVKGSATSQNDIVRRRFIPIDIDVVRPSKISSTSEEKEYAHKIAGRVYTFMKSHGFSEPIVNDSSSGYHLYYAIDLPADDEGKKIVNDVHTVLSQFFTDERVKIDLQVGDSNRLMRCPGTWGRKGRDSEDRPHRMARVLSAPEPLVVNTKEFLEEFVEQNIVKQPEKEYSRNSSSYNGEQFDVRAFLSEHNINVQYEAEWAGGTKLVLEECPFSSDHKAPDSAILLFKNGAIAFKCLHDSCRNHDWSELRSMLDPNAYSKKEHNYQSNDYRKNSQFRQYSEPAPPPIKPETPELGKKWLDLGDVEDVNLDDLPRIHTGFQEIDYLMGGGLFLSESSILSGINGSGKSAWLNTLSLNAIQDGHKVAIWTGELQASRLKRWIVQAASGQHVVESKKSPGKYFSEPSCIPKIVNWMEGKFLLYNNDYSNNYAQILSDMKEPLAQGYDFFIIDNLFSLDLEGLPGDDNAKQKALILKISDFAKKNKVHTILVAHPRKVVTFLRKEDILGSSALQNAVDNIFIIHRNSIDFQNRAQEVFGKARVDDLFKDEHGLNQYDEKNNVIRDNEGNVVEICKNREFGSLEKLVRLHYNEKNRHFYDNKGELPYGWENPPIQTELFSSFSEDLPFAAPTEQNAPF